MITSVVRRFGLLVFVLLALATADCAVETSPAHEVVASTEQAVVTTDFGFVYATLQSSSYDAPAATSFNNHGGVNHVTRLAAGVFRIDFPGLGFADGNVQVTSAGTGPTEHGGTVRHCIVASWGPSGTTQQVYVNCFNYLGNPFDCQFYVSYQRRTGTDTSGTAYGWAFDPTSAQYTMTSYQWSSGGGNLTVTREGVGQYLVSFPGQSSGTHFVEATAYGPGSKATCSPAPGSSDTNARVRCYDTNGALADSMFTIAYSHSAPNAIAAYSFATVQTGGTPVVTNTQGFLPNQCGGGSSTPAATATGSGSSVRVHFPQMSSSFVSSNVMAMSYDTTGRNFCEVIGIGSEAGGAFANVSCYKNGGPAPSGIQFVIVFTSTLAIVC
jgi:hypothetical protein